MALLAERFKRFSLIWGLAIFIPLGAATKQSMAATFILLASLLIVTTFLSSPRQLIPDRSVFISFFIFFVYILWVHFFSVQCVPCKSLLLTKIPMLGLVFWVASSNLTRFVHSPRPKIPMALILGLFTTSIFLIIEFLNDAVIYRIFSDRLNDPEVALSRYNRVTSALVIFVWPIAYWVYRKGNPSIAVIIILITCFTAALSDSNSALVVSILIPLVAIIAYFFPTFIFWFGLSSLGIFTLLSPIIFLFLLNWVKLFVDHIPPSTLDRVEIWHRTASAVLEAPWLGNGIGVTRYLVIPPELMDQYKYHVTATTHPHNSAIQLWLELGVIGVIIFLLVLWFVIQPLRKINSTCLCLASATAAGVIFTSLVSFGFWQETWLGIIGMVVICFKVALYGSDDNYPS